MTDIVFVLHYISNAETAKRYWHGEAGRLFSECLTKREVGHSVYTGIDICIEEHDLSWAGKPQGITIDQFKKQVELVLQDYRAVFIISDSPEAISSMTGKKGCLPFMLTEQGKPGFKYSTHIEINKLSQLNIYFEEFLPHHLLTILRKQPSDYKDEINRHNSRIQKQTGAADGVYILGTGSNGLFVYEECTKYNVKVLGFADNNREKQGTEFCSLPVVATTDLDPGHAVVIIASGNYTYDIYKQLEDLGFKYIQNLAEFYFAHDCTSQQGIFFHDDLWENRIRYHELYLLLADSSSRKVLENMVGFRQNFDVSMPGKICDRNNPQWFDSSFFTPSADHVFADGGAFDGDTALRFIDVNGNKYKAIHLFEPDPSIVKKAADNLREYKNIHFHNMGLSDKRGTLYFAQTGLTDGRLVEGNGIPITIDAIDNTVTDRISFLKLDVEGAEEGAIAGAARHIRDDSPMLAIAVYHKAEDIWSLTQQILSINPNYVFYLRHYTQFAYETVLYGLHRDFSAKDKCFP